MSYKLRIPSNFYFSKFRHIYNRNFRKKYIHGTCIDDYDDKFIQNKTFPACIDCKHFIRYNLTTSDSNTEIIYDDNDDELGKCQLFGHKNIITGKITYKYATTCRITNSICGPRGIYFSEKIKTK